MVKRQMTRFIIPALAVLLFALPVYAETSLEYAKIGQKIFPAFQCSIAAEHAKKPDAQKRLFTLGVESGRVFLKAVQQGKVKREDISKTVAIAVTMRLKGPSIDFMLGSMWEAALEHYYKKLTENCDSCVSDDGLKKMKGENNYRVQNCEFLK